MTTTTIEGKQISRAEALENYRDAIIELVESDNDDGLPSVEILLLAGKDAHDVRRDVWTARSRLNAVRAIEQADRDERESIALQKERSERAARFESFKATMLAAIEEKRIELLGDRSLNLSAIKAKRTSAHHSRVEARRILERSADPTAEQRLRELGGQIVGLDKDIETFRKVAWGVNAGAAAYTLGGDSKAQESGDTRERLRGMLANCEREAAKWDNSRADQGQKAKAERRAQEIRAQLDRMDAAQARVDEMLRERESLQARVDSISDNRFNWQSFAI